MKKVAFVLLCLGIYFLGTEEISAQTKPQKEAKEKAEKEKSPAIFEYEPEFLVAAEARRAGIDSIMRILDTLDISEGKRLKLIRDLYRNKESKRLNKILLAVNKYEDDIDE